MLPNGLEGGISMPKPKCNFIATPRSKLDIVFDDNLTAEGLANWQAWLLSVLDSHRQHIISEIRASALPTRSESRQSGWLRSAPVAKPADTPMDFPLGMEDEKNTIEVQASQSIGTRDKEMNGTTTLRRLETLSGNDALSASCKHHSSVQSLAQNLELKKELAYLEFQHEEDAIAGFFIRKLSAVAAVWSQVQEPQRSGVVFNIVHSRLFELLSAAVITSNAAFVTYTANWTMQNIGQKLPGFVSHVEIVFFSFYIVELLFRLVAHRLWFFINDDMKWNLFDFTLVLISTIDVVVTQLLDGADNGSSNLMVTRMLRMLKLAKILRTIRALRIFKDLAVMVDSFLASILALFWTMLTVLFVFYIFSLVFVQGLSDHLDMERNGDTLTPPGAEELQVKRLFGSVERSMLTLYMACTGGDDWYIFYDLLSLAGPFYAGLFVGFIYFFQFALVSILTGIFVEKASYAAKPDRDDMVLTTRKQTLSNIEEIKRICKILDPQMTGNITWLQFQALMKSDVLVAYLATAGLEIHEIDTFFHLISGEGKTEVSIDRFVEGCLLMKGPASSIDMQRTIFELQTMRDEVAALRECLGPKR